MKRAFLLAAASTLVLLLPPTSVIAKNATIGIYAIVDRVTFEPGAGPPNSVRICGVFVVPVPASSGNYRTPQRGYLYFRIAPGTEQATRRDWSELKTLAGSGKVAGFGQYWVPNPDDPQGNPHHSLEVAVHAEGDVASPDVYPLPRLEGVTEVKVGDKGSDPRSDEIAAQLALEKSEPCHHDMLMNESVLPPHRETTMPKEPDPELAQSIGQAVLRAAESYERETGKAASTIIIRLTGKLPNPSDTSLSATALNQYHYQISVDVQNPPGNSESK
jgi:hypothetical protein